MKIDIVSFVLYSNCKTNAQSRLARARRLSFSGQPEETVRIFIITAINEEIYL